MLRNMGTSMFETGSIHKIVLSLHCILQQGIWADLAKLPIEMH